MIEAKEKNLNQESLNKPMCSYKCMPADNGSGNFVQSGDNMSIIRKQSGVVEPIMTPAYLFTLGNDDSSETSDPIRSEKSLKKPMEKLSKTS